jgi:hypothetical protein
MKQKQRRSVIRSMSETIAIPHPFVSFRLSLPTATRKKFKTSLFSKKAEKKSTCQSTSPRTQALTPLCITQTLPLLLVRGLFKPSCELYFNDHKSLLQPSSTYAVLTIHVYHTSTSYFRRTVQYRLLLLLVVIPVFACHLFVCSGMLHSHVLFVCNSMMSPPREAEVRRYSTHALSGGYITILVVVYKSSSNSSI